MNDPALTPPVSSPDEEPPRSWFGRQWAAFKDFIDPPPDAEDLREVVEEIIEEPLSQSGLSSAERMLLSNIMTLRTRSVADCMVPRADIIAADEESDLTELVELISYHTHSRIPIYRGTLDDVIGMVHIKDVLPCLARDEVRTISELLRPVMFVAPSMPAGKLLIQMRQSRQHMALVVDEFGGIDGLVTIEDVVEEIVGEIEDEHDTPAAPPVITRADGTLLVDARMPIEEFESHIGFDLPAHESEEIDTVGGYVANLAGRKPNIGESFPDESGLQFEILETDQVSIKRLRVKGLGKRREPLTEQASRGR